MAPLLPDKGLVFLISHDELLNILCNVFVPADNVQVVVEDVPILKLECGWVQANDRRVARLLAELNFKSKHDAAVALMSYGSDSAEG